MTVLKRQYITDLDGKPIAVILPLEEFDLVADFLTAQLATQHLDAQLRQMEAAPDDALFLADLTESMTAFEHTDAEWWESDS
jgi:hypothetical protein